MTKTNDELLARKQQLVARGISNSTSIFVKEAKMHKGINY